MLKEKISVLRWFRFGGALVLLVAAGWLAHLHVGRGADSPWEYKGFIGAACICLAVALLLLWPPLRVKGAGSSPRSDLTTGQVLRGLLVAALMTAGGLGWSRLQLDPFGAYLAALGFGAVCLALLPASPRNALPMTLRPRQLAEAAAAGLLCTALFVESDGLTPYLNTYDGALRWRVFMFCVPPLVEELLFRGVLWSACRRFLPASLTVLATAAIFTASHGWLVYSGNRSTGAVAIAGIGLLLGLLRARTGSVAPGMIAHALANGLPWLLANLLET